MDPHFKDLPQEERDSLQQNGKANIHPETKRREAAEYRAAHKEEKAVSDAKYRATHKEEAAEYRDTHKEEKAVYRDTHKEEANRKARLKREAERIERRESGLLEKPLSDKAIEDKELRKQVYTAAYSAEGAVLGDQPPTAHAWEFEVSAERLQMFQQDMRDCAKKHPHVSSAGSHCAEFKFSVSDSHTEDASTTVLKVPTAQEPGSLEWNKADECTIIKSRIATDKQFPNDCIFVVDYDGEWLAVAPNLSHIVLCGSDDWENSMEQANTFAIQWNRQFSSRDVRTCCRVPCPPLRAQSSHLYDYVGSFARNRRNVFPKLQHA